MRGTCKYTRVSLRLVFTAPPFQTPPQEEGVWHCKAMHSRNFCRRKSVSRISEEPYSLASQRLGYDFKTGRILNVSQGPGYLIVPIAQDIVHSLIVYVFLCLVASASLHFTES